MSENNQVENTNEEMKSVDAEKICVKCKNIIPEESDFCIKCGAPVKKATEIPQERICRKCGRTPRHPPISAVLHAERRWHG